MWYRTLTVAVVAATLSGAHAAAPAHAEPSANTVTIGLRPGATAADTVRDLDATPGVRVIDSDATPQLDAVTVTVTGDAARALAGNPDVSYVEPTPTASALLTPNDPVYSEQWGTKIVKAPAAWNVTTGSPDVTVAVVDTGVTAVSDIAGRVLPGYDFVNDDADPTDDNGHGTLAATVIAAAGDNDTGLAGICWTCRILPVKVLGADGSGGHDDIAEGIVYAVDHGADIINLSLGGQDGSTILSEAVTYAAGHGVVVIAAAGNEGVTTPVYPAAYPKAIAVAGSTETDGRFDWSNYNGSWVDVAAPGDNPAQADDGDYYWFTGTSSAAPVVAGVAALGLSARTGVTAAQVRAAIEAAAHPVGSWVSYGRVDAEATIKALTSAPTIAWTAPATSSTPRRGKITVSATAAGAARVDLIRAGKVIGTDTRAPWSFTVDSAGLTGTHTLTLRATGPAGDTRSTSRSLLFDNTAPTISKVKVSKTRTTVTITPTVRDTTGLKQVKAVITARSKKYTLSSSKSPWKMKWKPSGRRGTFPVTVTATDKAGNTRTYKTKFKI
ncbi:S8 family serine peptidase [Actinoplanes flavus]|uniref:S8 family serine peptidase n=1 Tax=Actinoplanes flavus TaxID=2820290 RepID=A0ABS3UJ28_9ACTN|nr:S8 family serine peptidase [Actinoplanes flavus]MBO3738784.1 S8 family serine peptidase [Actinoplanes flavus]